MNRCSLPRDRAPFVTAPGLRAAGLALLLALAGFSAQAQLAQRIPPITAGALRGALLVTAPPEVLLNGRPARLAPGARIRGRNNLMMVSGALIGHDLPVRYTLDPQGLILEVWVLTDAEVAADRPPGPSLSDY